MARKRRKSSKGKIPLKVLQKRLAVLKRVVKRRGGKV